MREPPPEELIVAHSIDKTTADARQDGDAALGLDGNDSKQVR
jgi:hypothetical protein